ncbi:MAG: PhoH family protein [Candidatus Verstraetearchaeota archaeon]|jgi:phosphate starvation-inducible protein PhoH|nr:PhoH family protein [Candidatus Verstraetearchaeota archaeon]
MSILENIKPLTSGQEEMYKALKNKTYEILGFFGPTGTGKSMFSLAYGIDSIINNEYARFIVIRPVVDIVTGQELDISKGHDAFINTMKNYIRDIISNYVEWSKIESLINDGKIVLADPKYLRGRSFDNSIIFLDDIQLMRPESIIEAVIRVGRNSRLIVAGDPVFQALREVSHDPAAVIREVMLSEEKSHVVDLGIKDIIRDGAKRGLRFLLEYKLRSRNLTEEEKHIYEVVKAKSPDADVITITDLVNSKKSYEISQEYVPDALIIVKQGHMGRLVGKGGERINNAEKELGKRLRGIELNLDFKEMIRAMHPTSWIWKHIAEVDFAGPSLQIKVYEDVMGAAVGQKGAYVKFIDTIFRKLFGVGVKVVPVEREKQEKK